MTRPLQARLEHILEEVESSADARTLQQRLAGIFVELANEGLDYYFMLPLEQAKAGFIVQQTAQLGLAGMKQLMAPVIKGAVARLDHAQLVSISRSIRSLMT